MTEHRIKSIKARRISLSIQFIPILIAFVWLILCIPSAYGAPSFDFSVANSLESGGNLYKRACAHCHGKTGELIPPGDKASRPIAGMRKNTLVRILNAYRDGIANGGGASGTMSAALMRYKFTDQDIEDIAFYLESLRGQQEREYTREEALAIARERARRRAEEQKSRRDNFIVLTKAESVAEVSCQCPAQHIAQAIAPQPIAKPKTFKGYYYQVAAYRGEVPKDIMDKIAKYPYIVHISQDSGKPLYRYLIGAYDTYNDTKIDKQTITFLTKTTHVQRNMQPIVRYLDGNNTLREVLEDGSLGGSIARGVNVFHGKSAPTHNPAPTLPFFRNIETPRKGEQAEEGEADTGYYYVFATHDKDISKEALDYIAEQSYVFFKTQNVVSTAKFIDGYYYILATYEGEVPNGTLQNIAKYPYALYRANGYIYIMMGQFKTKAAMRSYAKIAQEITDIIHAPQNQKETPRVAHIKDKKMTIEETITQSTEYKQTRF